MEGLASGQILRRLTGLLSIAAAWSLPYFPAKNKETQ